MLKRYISKTGRLNRKIDSNRRLRKCVYLSEKWYYLFRNKIDRIVRRIESGDMPNKYYIHLKSLSWSVL